MILRCGAVRIVYRVVVDEEYQGYFYLAIEHQSTAQEQNFMAFRFMKYQLAIVDNHLKQHKKNKYLPIVFPILFYHGKKHLMQKQRIF